MSATPGAWIRDLTIDRVIVSCTARARGGSVVGAVALVPTVGFSLFPKAGTPQYHVDVETPDGTSLAETDRAVRFAERVIGAHPSTTSIFANIGKDNPMVYYNVNQRAEAPNRAQLLVLLNDYDNINTPRMLDSLRAQLSHYPGFARGRLVCQSTAP